MTIYTRRNSWLLDKHLIGILAKELKKNNFNSFADFKNCKSAKSRQIPLIRMVDQFLLNVKLSEVIFPFYDILIIRA